MAFSLAKVKEAFFDKAAVKSKIDPAVRKAFSKFGSFVRTRAKSSLKYKKGTAAPGEPPIVHQSAGFTRRKKRKGVYVQQPVSPLRELILFSYDADRKSVVIGPTLGGSQTGAPEALEHGGQSIMKRGGKWKRVNIAPRPFMQPAFDTELDKIGNDFKNLIK